MPCPRCCVASVLDALGHAGQAGKLPHDPASTDVARQARLTQLLRHDWVIHAKGSASSAPNPAVTSTAAGMVIHSGALSQHASHEAPTPNRPA